MTTTTPEILEHGEALSCAGRCVFCGSTSLRFTKPEGAELEQRCTRCFRLQPPVHRHDARFAVEEPGQPIRCVHCTCLLWEPPEPPAPIPVRRTRPKQEWAGPIGRSYFATWGLGAVVVRGTVRWDGRGKGGYDLRWEVRDDLGDLVAGGSGFNQYGRLDAQIEVESEVSDAIRDAA